MAVAVNLKPEFTAETPTLLFEGPYVNVGGHSYDVTADGQRFLVLEPAEPESAGDASQCRAELGRTAEASRRHRGSSRTVILTTPILRTP